MTKETQAEEIYKDSEEVKGPRVAKGGAIAPVDIALIKKLITAYISDASLTLTPQEEQQAINLYHRLGRIS